MLAQDDVKNKLITCIYTMYYTNIVMHCTLVLTVQNFLCLFVFVFFVGSMIGFQLEYKANV